jgi:putative nucleotidyltransferase with HDIG domain
MTRDEAIVAVEANVENDNLIKHMLASEAIMRALARQLDEDEDEWGLTGLLHDVDVELSDDDPEVHSRLAADMARDLGGSAAMSQAILRHNEAHGYPLESKLDKALWCADPLTGLIIAAALVRPDKSLAELKLSSLRKRFKENRFAAGANRDQITTCQSLGLELDDFLGLGLEAMQGIAEDLGL